MGISKSTVPHLAIQYGFEDGVHRLLLTDFHLQEICCPPDTTCRGLSQTVSQVVCCPKAFPCSYNMVGWPMHTLEGPISAGGGCCTTGLCFEYNDETLVVFQTLPIHEGTIFNSQSFYNCSIPATMGPVQTFTLPSSLSTGRVVATGASQKCQPENINQKELRISDRTPGTQTAWRSKTDEIAVKSQAEENWDGKNGKRRLRRFGCVVMALVAITVVMFVF